jgi:hypothetical protein
VPPWHYLLMNTESNDKKARNTAYQRAYREKWKARDPEGYAAYIKRGNRANYVKTRDRRLAQGRSYYARRREKWLLRNYGVTEQWYIETLANQGGKCAICAAAEPGGPHKVFSVDHDHKTGAVRGLLCKDCNHMLGMAKDNPSTLESAIKYLQKACQQT